MMKIRQLQLSAFETGIDLDLEGRLIREVARWFPAQYEYLGQPLVKAVVYASINRAKLHSQTTITAIRVFVALTFALGVGFDDDPQLAWASDALSNDFTDEHGRAKLLYVRGLEYCRNVLGPNSQYYLRALTRAQTRDLRPVWSDVIAWNYSDDFGLELRDIYPEKFAEIGSEGVRHLCKLGQSLAARNELVSEVDVGRYLILMFILGSGFEQDPRFPWIAPLLDRRVRMSPGSRCDALYEGARRHAEKWISHVLT